MPRPPDRKSTRLNSSHPSISYAVFCLKKKKNHASERLVEPNQPRSQSSPVVHGVQRRDERLHQRDDLGPAGQQAVVSSFFFNDTATTEIYTLSLHDALPIFQRVGRDVIDPDRVREALRTAL